MNVGGSIFQTESLKIVGCTRIQNPEAFRLYTEMKDTIKFFGLPNQRTITFVDDFGRDPDAIIDKSYNECYMWCYAPNVSEILKGGQLNFPEP